MIDEGGGGGVMATCSDCRDGLNSSGDPLSCWELVLGKGVRLLEGLSGVGGGGESGVGTWTGLGMGLNNKGEGLWLIESKLLVWGLHSITKRTSLN